MEMTSLREALARVSAREPRRNNFLGFSKRFDAFNARLPAPQLGISVSERKSLALPAILEEIDGNIRGFETAMGTEENGSGDGAETAAECSSDNRRKHERNIERVKHLLVKYPIRRMKDIETQLNNINYVDMVWRELQRNEMVEILRVDEEGNARPAGEVNFDRREDLFYRTTQKFYNYV